MKTKSMFFRRIINVIELICLSVIISPILVKGNFFRGEKEISDHAGITKSVLTYQEIVGGTVAEEGEFPWFAAFEPLVQCGGTK
mgnify:CR=1 FL=1